MADAFRRVGLPWAQFLIALAGVAGITSVVLVTMLSQARVLLAMARDGLLPQGFFGAVHPRFRTPWKSTIATGVFVAVLAGLFPIDVLLTLVNMGTLLAFAIVCGAVVVLRRIHPDAERPFRVPFVPLVPILGAVSCVLLMFSLPAENLVAPLRLAGPGARGLLCLRPPAQRGGEARLTRPAAQSSPLSQNIPAALRRGDVAEHAGALARQSGPTLSSGWASIVLGTCTGQLPRQRNPVAEAPSVLPREGVARSPGLGQAMASRAEAPPDQRVARGPLIGSALSGDRRASRRTSGVPQRPRHDALVLVQFEFRGRYGPRFCAAGAGSRAMTSSTVIGRSAIPAAIAGVTRLLPLRRSDS